MPTVAAGDEAAQQTAQNDSKEEFPVLGLLPKQETHAWDFVTKFPEYDGRGVKVAIFDTGVDPAASGLQVCPDGRPKILDIVDCTGSGDVDTSLVVKDDAVQVVDGVRQIKGLSGRTLRLNPKWENASGEWRIGIKRAYELFPKSLVTRVKAERRKEWDKKHLAAEVAVAREVSSWKAAHPVPTAADRKFLQDLEAKAGFLEESKADLDDPGPIYDCVVWKGRGGLDAGEGEQEKEQGWWAAVDTAEDGDLSEAVAMTDFDKLRQHGRFGDVACLNFGVHVYEGGDVLSIVVDAGGHGTHVAGIVAAYYPDDPEANGVAPGAQIVSLKIGDSRLGSMETGTGVVRAVTEAVRMGCDVINMSFGEAAALCDSGRVAGTVRDASLKHDVLFLASAMNDGPALSTVQAPGGTSPGVIGVGAYAAIDVAREAVCKHRVVFVASAGNNGPAISTSGTPGGTTPDIIAVGAYASPSLMSASFSMRETLEGGNFTWTSAGPTADGDIGVSVMAPGGAISPVPNWTLQKKQLMMGTSMSSPNCAGVVSLLLSGMKQRFPGKKLSVHRVRRALENTAKPLPGLETVVQGQGLVQVDSAFEYLVQHVEDATEDIHYKVAVNGGKRGVYLRQPEEVSKKTQWSVTVNPVLHDDVHNDRRTEFEMRVRLSCDGDWVQCSSDLELLHSGRIFNIAVDPTKLPPGMHHTCIEGYDVSSLGKKGPMFRVPLTALIPTVPDYTTVAKSGLTAKLFGSGEGSEGADFGPGKVVRRFVHPPHGASWMNVEVKDCREATNTTDGTRRIMLLHCVQLLPHTPYRDAECKKYLNMHPGQTEVYSMRLKPCAAVEISLAQNWNAIGPTAAELYVTFRGVSPSPGQVIVSAPLAMQELYPTASLYKWCSMVAPTKATISALGQRDLSPDGQQCYAMVLEYTFKQTEIGEVTPRLAALNEYLYESAYESQMYMIFDANKKLLSVGDCWPEAVKLSKGDYFVRVQVKHPEQSMLKRLKSHPLELTRKLTSSLMVPVHGSMIDLSTSTKAPSALCLDRGHSASYFFAEPPQDKLPKSVKPGDLLTGTAYFVRDNKSANSGGEGKRPGGYPVIFAVGPAKVAEASQESPVKNEKPRDAPMTNAEKLLDALRDLRIKHLENCKAKSVDAFQDMYKTVCEQIRADGRTDPDSYLPLLLARLHFLDREGIRRGVTGGEEQGETTAAEEAAGMEGADASDAAAPETVAEETSASAAETSTPRSATEASALDADADEVANAEDAVAGAEADVTSPGAAPAAAKAAAEATDDEGARTAKEKDLLSLRAVVAAADDVVAKIDQAEVAKQLGMNVDAEDAAMVSTRKEFEDKKKALADAFSRKARALAEIEEILGQSETTKARSQFLVAYSDLIRWADVSEDKYARVTLAFLRRKQRLGTMLKILTKLMSSTSKAISKEEATSKRALIFKELGWDHLMESDRKWTVIGYPRSYPLF